MALSDRVFQVVALGVLCSGLLDPAIANAEATRRGGFDGSWTVHAKANGNRCSDSYSVGIQVVGGRIVYSGLMAGMGSGYLGANGSIRLKIGEAVATGALRAASGKGTWRSSRCVGTWIATRL